MRRAILAILILGGAITAYGYYSVRTVEFVPEVSTVTVTEGDIVDTVGATGALEAVTTVQVGSQVSGIIQELHVDFNSIVREGDVIMRLDPSLFETQLEQARANLLRSQAEVERLSVAVDDAATQLRRSRELAADDLISETELEAADVALRSAQAQRKSAEAQVRQSQASLSMNEVNLEHTVIRAPIDGIVTSRLVDVGQTVAASFQAPELFVIAADLTKMRVIANIDESDVGRIRPNQRVTFTVDAFPAEEFEGAVSQIRLEPIVTQNVRHLRDGHRRAQPRAQAQAGNDRHGHRGSGAARERDADPELGAAVQADAGDVRDARPAGAARAAGRPARRPRRRLRCRPERPGAGRCTAVGRRWGSGPPRRTRRRRARLRPAGRIRRRRRRGPRTPAAHDGAHPADVPGRAPGVLRAHAGAAAARAAAVRVAPAAPAGAVVRRGAAPTYRQSPTSRPSSGEPAPSTPCSPPSRWKRRRAGSGS